VPVAEDAARPGGADRGRQDAVGDDGRIDRSCACRHRPRLWGRPRYGDGVAGGSVKSYFALAVSRAVATGTDLPGLHVAGAMPVLYLDFETSQERQERRLAALCRGLDLTSSPGIVYRRMVRPLIDDIAAVRVLVRQRQIGLVVVDSVGYAMAGAAARGDPSSETIRFYQVLRSLETTALTISHVTKISLLDDKDLGTPYGSIFNLNSPQGGVFAVRKDAGSLETGQITFALVQVKVNEGPPHPPITFTFDFRTPGKAILRAADLKDAPDLMERMNNTYRVRRFLEAGERSVEEIAEALNLQKNQVRVVLSRLATANLATPHERPNPRAGEPKQHATIPKWGLVAKASRDGK
jgi:hypothetical protein